MGLIIPDVIVKRLNSGKLFVISHEGFVVEMRTTLPTLLFYMSQPVFDLGSNLWQRS